MSTIWIEAALMVTLIGTTWQGPVDVPLNITFEENRAHGTLSCNNFRTNYRESANSLDFGGIITTRKSCSPKVIKQEYLVLSFLKRTAAFAVDGRDLVLKDLAGKTIVRLVRKA
jgi:heat shock protein HslJ